MKNIFFTSILLALSVNSLAFDSSWISENVHDGCTLIESKAFIYRSEEWDIDATPYGREIGATNGLVDSEEKTQNGTQYNVSYYNCPSDCIKSGATEENGMLGKEYILDLIGYKPIQCHESLVVSQLYEIDFDKDGYMGYAIRYKTTQGGSQGSSGHLFWEVDFIKNSNGAYSLLKLDDTETRSAWGLNEVYYTNINVKESELIIKYLVKRSNVDVSHIEKSFYADGSVLVLSK